MAKLEDSMKILMELEFNSPKNALHKNKTESDYTFMGIYRKYHPNWKGWELVDVVLKETESIEEASEVLYYDSNIRRYVYDFYRKEFYSKMKLSHLKAQHTADELFIFGVNVGNKEAVKVAQTIVEVTVDGIVGNHTIDALNKYDVEEFSKIYDIYEMKYYSELIKRKPKYKIYANGWKNRAEFV